MKSLVEKSKWLRKEILLSAQKSGGRGSHLGGTMSCIELLVSLYYSKIIKFRVKQPEWENRDRILNPIVFFSKSKTAKKSKHYSECLKYVLELFRCYDIIS